ncbi:M56 family metallopeptidase [Singulisphaera sp. PoT]|uniref:M56 family metallopeptidase n=1 Tax=Singulisphaera sp. PoT TaxID=3411797 RepID=UPI003BF5B2B9
MSPTAAWISAVWTALGWTMLHLAWVGALVGVIALLGRKRLRSASPETRYGFALACLFALAASPVPIFAQVFEPPPRAIALSTMALDNGSPTGAFRAEAARTRLESTDRLKLNASSGSPLPVPGSTGRLNLLLRTLPWIWLVGSTLSLSLLGTGLIGLGGLRRSSRPIDSGPIAERCRALAQALDLAGSIGVGVCDRLAVPLLIGIFRPLILLPPDAATRWSVEQLEMVLLHELAHLRRRDNVVNLVQRLIESFLFFHPAVWWLSAWIRLERESCCDRLVVARTGRPCAYVEMLVALSGSGHERGRPALAMADRQVMTRIRRILNLEDRSMRWTLPEGLGVLGAAIVGLGLILSGHAAAPRGGQESRDALRAALRKAVTEVSGLKEDAPDHRWLKGATLAAIAEAQIKIEDRDSARSTLKLACSGIDTIEFDPRAGLEDLEYLVRVAQTQREATGDLDGARSTLDRLAKRVESIPVDPEAPSKVDHPHKDLSRIREWSGMAGRAALLLGIAMERIALKDIQEARRLCDRAVIELEGERSSLKPFLLGPIGLLIARSGDAPRARQVIELARQSALKLDDLQDRHRCLGYVASELTELGDLDGAIELVRSLPGEDARAQGFHKVLRAFADEASNRPMVSLGGIKITIGADSLEIKAESVAGARFGLPKIAEAARKTLGPLDQARFLSALSHLQAKAGDFAGALATAETIPALSRADYPGPSDGFYDAIRPATFALIARLRSQAGEKAEAGVTFERALALTRGVTDDFERIIARIVIAKERVEAGEKADARPIIDDAIALALGQPEPRRSRSLATLARIQIQADEIKGASKTAEALRAFPCLEKLGLLEALADWHEKAGDPEAARSFFRQSLACLEAKGSRTAADRPKVVPATITADTFIDPDMEFDEKIYQQILTSMSMSLHARLGDAPGAVASVQNLPRERREDALRGLAMGVAERGRILEALALAETIKSTEDRLTAVAQVASSIKAGPGATSKK